MQNKLPLDRLAARPRSFNRSASSAPAASASARAKTCRSLLPDLIWANGSSARRRQEAVTTLQSGRGSTAGAGCRLITTVAGPAPAGEYPRGPTPRERVIRRMASPRPFAASSSAAYAASCPDEYGTFSPSTAAPRWNRSRCRRQRQHRPCPTRNVSKIESPYRKPRSNTETTASASATNFPFRKTITASIHDAPADPRIRAKKWRTCAPSRPPWPSASHRLHLTALT